MAKKRSRATQTSKGIVAQNPNRMGRRISKEIRREYKQSSARDHNQLLAYMKGKNVMVTIPTLTQMKLTNVLFVCLLVRYGKQ